MQYERVKVRHFTGGTLVAFLLMLVGFVAAIYRYTQGLGAATNLSDSYPWGLWIGFDVLCGVALAAGGFTTAAAVYIFGREKYHVLIRPAILTAFLGYVFVAIAILVDLGLPWNIWHPIVMWPEHSAMFEVAWCVMLYLAVLFLEFMPPVFERFNWTGLHELWKKLVPVFVILALAFFTYIMSHNLVWTIVAFVFFIVLALLLPALFVSRPGVPILLIIAGILYSTAHQSSLGSIFLLTPGKLNHLWWSPMLPINFFLSAVAVGFAMVIFEATLAGKAFKHHLEKGVLPGFGRICAWILWIYLIVRVVDVIVRGQLGAAFTTGKGMLFLIEIVIGVIIPALIMSSAKSRERSGPLFFAALLTILGVIFNRLNVAILGITPSRLIEETYFPSIGEILITVGVVSALIFFYSVMVKMFPVFSTHAPGGGASD